MVQIDPICMVTGPPELDPAAVQVGGYVRKAP
jgi:hypothetical protein